jgi:hypothetical protein
MAVGDQPTHAEINATALQVVRQVYQASVNVQRFQAYLNATTDAAIIALPTGGATALVQADVTLLKSAISDLNQLMVTIFTGAGNLASAKDFRTFAGQILGPGLY